MPTHGMHSERLGIKKLRSDPVDYITNLIAVTITITPGAINTLTGALSSAITATGAKFGDRVEVFPPYSIAGVIAQGHVTAADEVKITFFNTTGSTITLAGGDWIIQVIRP